MSEKKYWLGGFIPPILHWKDPDYCEYGCPICRRARDGNRLAQRLQQIELAVTRGGCPWGRARQAKYGVPPEAQKGTGVICRTGPAGASHK